MLRRRLRGRMPRSRRRAAPRPLGARARRSGTPPRSGPTPASAAGSASTSAERNVAGAGEGLGGDLVGFAHIEEDGAAMRVEIGDGDDGWGGGSGGTRDRGVGRRARGRGRGAQRDLELPGAQSVDHEHAAEERLADPRDEHDRLRREQAADLQAERPEHADVRTGRHLADAAVRIQVAQAHGRRPGRRRAPEHRDLRVEPLHGAPHERHAEGFARGCHGLAGVERVGAVDHEVRPGEQPGRVAGIQSLAHTAHDRLGREVARGADGAVDLRRADVGQPVHDLALQVGRLDDVVVDHDEFADPGRGQGEHDGRAQTAGADHGHARGGEPALADLAQPGEAGVPRGAGALVRAECGDRLHERREGHDPRVRPAEPPRRRVAASESAPSRTSAQRRGSGERRCRTACSSLPSAIRLR